MIRWCDSAASQLGDTLSENDSDIARAPWEPFIRRGSAVEVGSRVPSSNPHVNRERIIGELDILAQPDDEFAADIRRFSTDVTLIM